VSPVLLLVFITGCGRPADSPLVTLERGRMLLQRGQVEEAMTIIDRAVQALPGDDEALFLRGLAYERLQLLEKALADYSECVRIAPDRTDALNNQAVTLAKLKRFEDAAEVFTRLVRLAPADALAVRNRGRCHFDLGQFELALRDYDRAIELAPEDASAWLQRGNVQLAKKDYLLAESDYSRAVELDPQLAAAWMNRGVSRYRRGERAAAKDDLARAQQLDDSIAIPALDYFPAVPSQPDEAVPFDGGAARWPAARAIAEFSLRLHGVTTGEWISEVAAHNCGVVRATDDAGPLLVVVACLHPDGRQFTAPPEIPARWSALREPADGVNPAAESVALLLLERAADNPELWQVASFTRNWSVSPDAVDALIMQRP
jgi:tetratricopeptide (TPR) repeat protein